MIKNKNWTVLFILLSTSFFLGGVSLRPLFEYSPIFGSTLGFLFLIIALCFSLNRYQK